MARTVAQGIAWAKAHPTRQNVPGAIKRWVYNWSWDQLCAAFVYWMMGATTSYTSANNARKASGALRSGSTNLPVGAIVWFKIGLFGHVGVHIGQGRIAMASKWVSNWGTAVGYTTIQSYVTRSKATYLGYTMRFGPSVFSTTSTSGGGTTPISEAKEPIMNYRLLKLTDKTATKEATYLKYELPAPRVIGYDEAVRYNTATDSTTISKGEKETATAWKARQAAIKADWTTQAAREVSAVANAVSVKALDEAKLTSDLIKGITASLPKSATADEILNALAKRLAS